MVKQDTSVDDKGDKTYEWRYRYPIGVLEARRALNDLARFEWLIKHWFNYAGDMLSDPNKIPLKKLIKNYSKKRQHSQLQTEINEMIPTIIHRFRRINAPEMWEFQERGEKQEVHALADFFRIRGYRQMHYEALIETIERAK